MTRCSFPSPSTPSRTACYVTFSRPLDRAVAEQPGNQFAQAWNYRYSSGYGSPELSARHPGMPGHDPLAIQSAHVLADGRTLFLEIPEIQPVNQLHLHLRVEPASSGAFRHRSQARAPLHRLPRVPSREQDDRRPPDPGRYGGPERGQVPNPWRRSIRGAREIHLAAGQNLTFAPAAFTSRG